MLHLVRSHAPLSNYRFRYGIEADIAIKSSITGIVIGWRFVVWVVLCFQLLLLWITSVTWALYYQAFSKSLSTGRNWMIKIQELITCFFRAEDLMDKDIAGKSDPYVVIK